MIVNVLVLITISITLSVISMLTGGHYGMGGYGGGIYGMSYDQLAVFCLVWGMAGSFISLLLSRFMAKMMMGIQIIEPDTRDSNLQDLVQMVHHLAQSAGLPKMPQVGVYDSPELNAFATGPTKSRALVAVSTGLMSRLSRDELDAVLGHEISHVANGDMVTLTLIQGVINAFVMFFARIAAFVVSQALRGDNEREERRGPSFMNFILVWVFEIFFSILGSIVVMWFSRFREYRADAGGAKLAGREKMISALRALQKNMNLPPEVEEAPKAIQAFQIAGRREGIALLFSSHPPIEDRIAALQALQY